MKRRWDRHYTVFAIQLAKFVHPPSGIPLNAVGKGCFERGQAVISGQN